MNLECRPLQAAPIWRATLRGTAIGVSESIKNVQNVSILLIRSQCLALFDRVVQHLCQTLSSLVRRALDIANRDFLVAVDWVTLAARQALLSTSGSTVH